MVVDSSSRIRVAVTGAGGFVGRALIDRLIKDGGLVPRALSSQPSTLPRGIDAVAAPTLDANGDWSDLVRGADVVVHLAARVHVMRDTAADPLAAFRTSNVLGTERIATQAASAGVRRFVYVSSIKVNGEQTEPGRRFSADDDPHPQDPYAISKLEAELALKKISAETGLEVVVIRPPLIYGPGVKANFRRMMNWVSRGIPLPFGAIDNRRSLVALDNVVDLLVQCITHPRAANRTFLAGDGEDLSTPQLLRRLALAMDKQARLIPVPVPILRAALALAGQAEAAGRLCDSLQIDISASRNLLGWTPPVTVDEGLRRTAIDFRDNT